MEKLKHYFKIIKISMGTLNVVLPLVSEYGDPMTFLQRLTRRACIIGWVNSCCNAQVMSEQDGSTPAAKLRLCQNRMGQLLLKRSGYVRIGWVNSCCKAQVMSEQDGSTPAKKLRLCQNRMGQLLMLRSGFFSPSVLLFFLKMSCNAHCTVHSRLQCFLKKKLHSASCAKLFFCTVGPKFQNFTLKCYFLIWRRALDNIYSYPKMGEFLVF